MHKLSFFPIFFLLFSPLLRAAPAPNFTVTTSDNTTLNLYNDFVNQGKVLVVEAFFTTCPPCNTHAPYWQSLYQNMTAAFPGKVEFMLLSTLSTNSNTKVAQYKTNKGLTMPGVGNNGGSLTALNPYLLGNFGDFLGTPTFFIISPASGEVIFDVRGSSPQETMNLIQGHIEALLPKECTLNTPKGVPIDSVWVSAATAVWDTTFLVSKKYGLSGIPGLGNQSYSISAEKNGNFLENVSTYDLVLISKHILGIDTFTQGWQALAADVNCSNSVTNFDILSIRKVILGLTDTFPCASWLFQPDPPGSNSTQNGSCLNLTGIKRGDLNPPSQLWRTDERRHLSLSMPDLLLEAGATALIPVLAGEYMSLHGIQAAWHSTEHLDIQTLRPAMLSDLGSDDYQTQPGQLRLAYARAQAQVIAEGDVLFYIQISARRTLRLSEALALAPLHFPAEVYLPEPALLSVQWNRPVGKGDIFPNPVRNQLNIRYTATANGKVWCLIKDAYGRLQFNDYLPVQKGDNLLHIDTSAWPPGAYWCSGDVCPASLILKVE
jgi:hypothetical protein